MKKLVLLWLCLLAPSVQAAQFDIYTPEHKPLKLAWIIGSDIENETQRRIIHDVTEQDLNSSQSFVSMDSLSFLNNTSEIFRQVVYSDWRVIGTEILTVARLRKTNRGWEVNIAVHDAVLSQLLAQTKLHVKTTQARRLGHLIADFIYETALGVKGHFDTHILYVHKHGKLSDLVYIEQDGSKRQNVGRNFSLLLSPDWSPNNQLVALNTYVDNRPRLETFHLGTGKRHVFGKFSGLNSTPEWSPDGKYIAAALSYTGNSELHLYNVATKKWRQLTHHWAIDTTPTWSPDSKMIAFTSNRSGKPQIHRVSIKDGLVQQISVVGSYNTTPSWSPRGDRIAFITRKKWQYALATMRADDGTDVRYLVTGGRIESPSWSPNAQMLLFSREKNGLRSVYRTPSWGGKAQAITPANEDASDPSWSH
ncbi:MAG: Tol-Pal system beta propeller repeat protein TolB [Mariprofundaceae bacterium]|nr:Tol-Pal system beta propeller repeat protein TolB [Mariprofundaceae bacterium]